MTELTITDRMRGTKRRVLEFTDGQTRTTSHDVVRALGLHSGTFPDSSVVLSQIDEAEYSMAFERALRLVNYRERSEQELRGKLCSDGYPDSVVDLVVERFLEIELVNDMRFTGCFVRSKRMAGWGSRRIGRKLAEFGISEELMNSALDENLESEYSRALDIATRRPICNRADAERVLGRLVRKGFPFEIAIKACREAEDASRGVDEGAASP